MEQRPLTGPWAQAPTDTSSEGPAVKQDRPAWGASRPPGPRRRQRLGPVLRGTAACRDRFRSWLWPLTRVGQEARSGRTGIVRRSSSSWDPEQKTQCSRHQGSGATVSWPRPPEPRPHPTSLTLPQWQATTARTEGPALRGPTRAPPAVATVLDSAVTHGHLPLEGPSRPLRAARCSGQGARFLGGSAVEGAAAARPVCPRTGPHRWACQPKALTSG